MKRGKIILKKESKPEQKKSHKKYPKLNHQLQKKPSPPRAPGSAAGRPPETASRRQREWRIA
jgi:hypothetical protein